MKKILLTTLLLIIGISAFAQPGYNINFRINGLKDTTVYLGHFYGESTYVKDTARVSAIGEFKFDGSTPLPYGIYFLVMNKTRVFDFVVNKDQNFTITTNKDDYIPKMKVEGDIDNELYLNNLLFNSARNEEAGPFVKVLQDSISTEAQKQNARAELQKINEMVVDYQDSIINKYPEAVISKIYKATQPIEVPDAPEGADSTFGFKYYKSHYWDNFDLADETMLRISEPLYRKKVEDYLDRLFLQHPDTITKEIFRLAEIAKENEETYKYLVWTVTLKYQQPEIMGLDEVFVNIYDKFFASGEMDYWANESLKKNLKDQAEKFRLSLIGKKAPNMIMMDQNLQPKSLHDIQSKYTVIFFFDPDCGFCKKETPILVDLYNKQPIQFEVFAVSADTSMTKMRDYIKEMGMKWTTVNGPRTYTKPYQEMYDAFTTPTIYILDEKKTIIAKKLPAARIEEFLKNYERMKKGE